MWRKKQMHYGIKTETNGFILLNVIMKEAEELIYISCKVHLSHKTRKEGIFQNTR